MSTQLTELIQEINGAGFLINNLSQLADGRWRASIRLDVTFEFGEGTTPEDALLEAKALIIRPSAKAAGKGLTKALTLSEIGL